MSLSFFYSLSKDVFAFIRRRRSIPPQTVLERRKRWQVEFGEERYRCWNEKLRDDIILVNINKMSDYIDEKRESKNAYFRLSLMQANTSHCLIYLNKIRIVNKNGKWKESLEDTNDMQEVYLCGELPYEYVEEVYWHGDDFYTFPIVYCHFWGVMGGPFKRLAYYRLAYEDARFPERYIKAFDYKEIKRPTRREKSRYYKNVRKNVGNLD